MRNNWTDCHLRCWSAHPERRLSFCYWPTTEVTRVQAAIPTPH